MTIEKLLDLCLESIEVYENAFNNAQIKNEKYEELRKNEIDKLKEVVERLKIENRLFNDKNNNKFEFSLAKYIYELPIEEDREILVEAIRNVIRLKRDKIRQLNSSVNYLTSIQTTYNTFKKIKYRTLKVEEKDKEV